MFACDLAETGAGAAGEIAAGLRAGLVGAADELPRASFKAQSSAMTAGHPHVCAIAVEPNELLGAFTETLVVVAGHAHIRFKE